MCIRVEFAPRAKIHDPWDSERNVIIIPDDLSATTLFALRAVRAVLRVMEVDQDHFGARCWCGDEVPLLPAIPRQRQNEVIHSGA